jgi:CBS domain-containing protein
MKAADVMVTDVITLRPQDTVKTAAAVLLDKRISAAPVIDDEGRLVGIVSEGDLMRRAEIGTERRRSWWLELMVAPETKAAEFVKAHAVKVADVMTKSLVTATEETSLRDVATLLEKNGIKRVPIVRGEKVAGIVSRRNLLQAFTETAAATGNVTATDGAIKDMITEKIRALPWGEPWLVTVTVADGGVELWGPVDSEQQRQALRVAAESTPGVKEVKSNLYRIPRSAAA